MSSDELRTTPSRDTDDGAGAVTGGPQENFPSENVSPPDADSPREDARAGGEAAYRDPYAGTGGDMLAEPEPEAAQPGSESVAQAPADEVPAHAAPADVVLFDQDPAQVQARWRELQTSFVDDPGEAVQRADGLVGEVVESLTSSLNSRTNALRERWKDPETADTEQLRLALRDYRGVLERLLALSNAHPQGMR
ncbi:hypothetical protein ABZ897_06075 [Nonomuraea sp. NPDC046802]|uniref:hypothetical protein n=1 Tax=Nonomuraea sp. NPDC046802 TaxID=3154919 RepID=UPI00340CDFB0